MVVAQGWVQTATLQQIATGPSRSGCCYGSTSGAENIRRGRRPKPFFYEGPAHVAIGTTIFAARGKGAWAKVEKDSGFTVRYDEGDVWAEVTNIPGVSGRELRAYVAMTAIKPGS